MSEAIEIRAATRDDLNAIAVIQDAARPASQWRPVEYLRHTCWVAVVGGDVAGFLVAQDLGEEREILNLAVDPQARRRGVATALVQRELSRRAGVCFLEVRESNDAARLLYRKLGFEEISSRPGYYQNPPERAIVMRFFS